MKSLKAILIILLISGCANLPGIKSWCRYEKESVHNTVTRNTYKSDTLHLGYVSFSAWGSFRNKNPNKLEIHEDTIWGRVKSALVKLNLPMDVSDEPEYFELTDKMRKFRTGTQFRDSLRGKLPSNKSWLVPYVEYTTIWDKQMEAGAASYTAFYTGREAHSIYTRLHFAILKNDTLIYYSGHMHHDTLTRLRHEPFKPSLSQAVFDSLAVLSMEEYIKRLE
jgi:hypothetical protein